MGFPIDNLKKTAIAVIVFGGIVLGVIFIVPLLGVIVPLVIAGAILLVLYLFFKKKF